MLVGKFGLVLLSLLVVLLVVYSAMEGDCHCRECKTSMKKTRVDVFEEDSDSESDISD